METPIIATIATIIPPLAFGISDSLWKRPVNALGPGKVILIRNVLTTSLLLVPLLLYGNQIALDLIPYSHLFLGFLICGISYFGLYFFNKAHQNGPIAILIPICNSNCIISFLIATLFFEQVLSPYRIAGISLILAGTALMSYWEYTQNSKLSNALCLRYSLLAALFWGISYGFFGWCTQRLGVNLFSVLLEGTILLLSVGRFVIGKEKGLLIAGKENVKVLLLIVLIAFCGAMGVYSGNLDYSHLGVVSMIVLGAFSMLLPQLAAKFVYKEQFSSKRYIAIGLVFCGLLLSYWGV